MIKLPISITCENCCTELDEEVTFNVVKQIDDLVLLKCPHCETIISLDEVELSKISLCDWINEHYPAEFYKYVKGYFSSEDSKE